MNITISPGLQSAIEAKAEAMKTDPDATMEVLLWMGLAAQDRREAEIAEMVERLRSPGDPSTAAELVRVILGAEIDDAKKMPDARFSRATSVKVKPQP